MFTVALFTTARIWKQPKCPSTEEWIKRDVIYIFGIHLEYYNGILWNITGILWNITMECYSAIKRNETVPFAETGMDLETDIDSEVSQTMKDKYCII